MFEERESLGESTEEAAILMVCVWVQCLSCMYSLGQEVRLIIECTVH